MMQTQTQVTIIVSDRIVFAMECNVNNMNQKQGV